MTYTIFVKILGLIIFSYTCSLILIHFFQKQYIYFPTPQDFNNCPGFAGFQAQNINGTRFYHLQQSDQVLIFFHGNAGSTCDRSPLIEIFNSSEYSLIFVEYAGYSNDPQPPSKKRILNDVDQLAEFLNIQGYTKTVVVGNSIGSGPASYLTTKIEVDKLVLIAPFNSLAAVAQSYYPIFPMKFILTENYDNASWLEQFEGELLILHGSSDSVIKPKFSQQLFDGITTKQKFRHTFPQVGHNTIFSSEEAVNILQSFIQN